MGGGAFILLKTRRAGPESAKQVEIRLANLLKILAIAAAGPKAAGGAGDDMQKLYRDIFADMANAFGIRPFVIWITMFARKTTQYPAAKCRVRLKQVLVLCSVP